MNANRDAPSGRPIDPREAGMLDRAFESLRVAPAPPLSAGLAARLAADAAATLKPRPSFPISVVTRRRWRADARGARLAAMAMAASVALGLWLGGAGVVDPFPGAGVAADLADLDLFSEALGSAAATELFAEKL